jgi:hypothetical protein
MQNTGQQYHDESFPAPSVDEWHHVVVRYDRGTDDIQVHVDAVAQTMTGNRAEGMSGTFGDSDLTLMARGTAAYHPGDLSEYAIYSGWLTDTQIEDHFDALSEPPPSGPVDIEVKGVPSTTAVGKPSVNVGELWLNVKGIASTDDVPGVFILSSPAEAIDLFVQSAIGAASVGGPLVRVSEPTDLDELLSPIRVEHEGVELTMAWARSWQEVLSDTGTGEVEMANDDPQLAAIGFGAVLTFSVDDIARFSAIVEKKARQIVAQGEEVDETTKLSGRGLLAEWEDAIVYPYGGAGVQPTSDTRTFSWASPDIEPEGWVDVIGLFRQSERDLYAGSTLQGLPPGWPAEAVDAFWLWGMGDGDIPVEGPHVPHPVGDNYFRSWVTVAEDGPYSIFVAGDNGWDLYIDGMYFAGENFPGTEGYAALHRVDVELSAGPHLIAAKVTNFFAPGNNPRNWGGLLLAVFDNAGAEPNSLGDLIHMTSWGEAADPWAEAWKALPYPDSLAVWPIGRVIRILLEEAQARGQLVDWELGFTDTTDSRGNAWPKAAEVSFSVGLDLLSALRQLAETYIEFRASATQRKLYGYIDGQAGVTTAVAFEPAVNVLEMSQDLEG